MSIITKTDNGIIYKLKDELVCIEAYGRDIIRVRITRNSTLSDENGLCLMWRTVPSRQRLQREKPL